MLIFFSSCNSSFVTQTHKMTLNTTTKWYINFPYLLIQRIPFQSGFMRRDLVKIHFNFPYLILSRIFFQFGSMRWDLVKTLFNSPITCLIIKIHAVQFQSCLFHVSLATLPYRLGGTPQRHFVYTLLCFLCNTSVSHCLYFLGPPQCILALISLSLSWIEPCGSPISHWLMV